MPKTPVNPAPTPVNPTPTPANPSPGSKKAVWCVPKVGVSDAQLQANLDYACGHGIDCSPIQPGGACFEPNTLASHAAYAMNLVYQTAGRNPWNCDFSQTATLSSKNPSKFSKTTLFCCFPHVNVITTQPITIPSLNQDILGGDSTLSYLEFFYCSIWNFPNIAPMINVKTL